MSVKGSIDTIAAVATAPGRGGIGIIRISGPMVPELGRQLLGTLPEPRLAELHTIRDARSEIIDEGICLYFKAPNSFTGEDTLELQCHGGPAVLDMLLARVLDLGVRQARAGEFSERAFLNDKLDLIQAEAIADLIESSTEQAVRAASRSLQGVFSRRVHALVEALTALRCYVEAAIDFPEEEIDFLGDGQVQADLLALIVQLKDVEAEAKQGRLLREGMTLVIAGRPNAGKSSLLNALAGRESAIVTPIAGTTRDLLREDIQIDGMPLHIIDTAGLRESDDPVEKEGVRRAWSQIAAADRVLLVVDDQDGFTPDDQHILDRLPRDIPHTLVFNKIDISGRAAGITPESEASGVCLSAKSKNGLHYLRQHLKEAMGFQETAEGCFSARRRHLDSLRIAGRQLGQALSCLESGAGELLAEELRIAQQHLAQITGEFSSDDLLGAIFSEFCIGK